MSACLRTRASCSTREAREEQARHCGAAPRTKTSAAAITSHAPRASRALDRGFAWSLRERRRASRSQFRARVRAHQLVRCRGRERGSRVRVGRLRSWRLDPACERAQDDLRRQSSTGQELERRKWLQRSSGRRSGSVSSSARSRSAAVQRRRLACRCSPRLERNEAIRLARLDARRLLRARSGFRERLSLGVPRTFALSETPRYARRMSELEEAFGPRIGSAEGSQSDPLPDRAAYEPPELRALGTLAELTAGVVGKSDGLGPGSAVEPGP